MECVEWPVGQTTKVKRSTQLNPGKKKNFNGVFICSEQLLEDLPQDMHCTVD
ncbi:hypothetical protein Syun_025591 [Stephania yunnanensis]|uniref:Uncharacterized protein n=1 Tax=Stephania yunnanensis TaxID=152371 RepID=A0AAP0ESM9_9MAGN